MLQPIELLRKELAELKAVDSETQFTKKARANELIPAYENSIKFLEAVDGVNASTEKELTVCV